MHIRIWTSLFMLSMTANALVVYADPLFESHFDPVEIEELTEGHEAIVTLNVTSIVDTAAAYKVDIKSKDTDIVTITDEAHLVIPKIAACSSVLANFTIKGKRLGRATLSLDFVNEDTKDVDQSQPDEYDVSVVRAERVEDTIFEVALALIIIINNVGFGCKFDWLVAKNVLRKPLAAIIRVCGQYILLPLVRTYCVPVCSSPKNTLRWRPWGIHVFFRLYGPRTQTTKDHPSC